MLVLSAAEVLELLDLDRLVDLLRDAMIDLSAGRASAPPRIAATVPEAEGILAAMPAYLPSAGALTTKLVSLFHKNQDRPTHQAVICCFDPTNGTPIALLDGTYVTATRTAAGSALATRLLAGPNSKVVAIIGTGVQARTHATAMARLAGVESLRIAGRDSARTAALVEELKGLPVEAAASIEDAVRSADIVCATTHTDTPVVQRAWLRPGTHVNSVGYNTAGAGEVDDATIRAALVVVESRAAALAPPPAGAVELAGCDPAGCVEVGEIAAGLVPGRTGDDQITVYKSVGVAVQDAAAAAAVLEAARARGIGTEVTI